ncbi:MAG: ubiquinone/menaquinone biosynthesis methyltransferase [Chloroflexi bacterium]|nr:ubiquinone/menaquinone biosynthesis methyltransferase [Chloroflexota bacterium]
MSQCADNAARGKPLYEMFNAVPPRYDLVNHVLTLGLDKCWRLAAARECLSLRPKRVLDLCCGTGDLAINISQLSDTGIDVQGFDYSQPMLDIAAAKAKAAGKEIPFTRGEAAAMPFADRYFDCVGISFAFRNLIYKNPLAERHIAEVLRVLAPGGRFVIVETSQPEAGLVRKLFHLYLRAYVRNVGYWFSGNKGAYHYLSQSAARFYSPEKARDLLLAAGFSAVSYRPFLFGAVGIHVAVK